jgi:HSP20 family protein
MLMRSDPFRDWDRLASRMLGQDDGSAAAAPIDAYRSGDVVTVDFDLPGVDPASIDIQVERGELRLQAERRSARPEGAQSLVQERFAGTISRRLMLGDQLDTERVDAEYTSGVLSLRIPLSETAKPRRVEVRSSEQQEQTAISV